MLINIYAPNTEAPKYTRKILGDFKKDINSNTLIIGDFNTPLPTMDIHSKQRIINDIVALNKTVDEMEINTLSINKYVNVNGLNAPIKRHRVAEWMRTPDPYICCLQKTHLRTKDLQRLTVKGQKKYSMQMEMKNYGTNTYI